MVTQVVSGIMMPVDNPFLDIQSNDSVNISVYFDPGIKGTFKYAFMATMKEYSMLIESSMIFSSFNSELEKNVSPISSSKNGLQGNRVFL